jgi:hypothetical protein
LREVVSYVLAESEEEKEEGCTREKEEGGCAEGGGVEDDRARCGDLDLNDVYSDREV